MSSIIRTEPGTRKASAALAAWLALVLMACGTGRQLGSSDAETSIGGSNGGVGGAIGQGGGRAGSDGGTPLPDAGVDRADARGDGAVGGGPMGVGGTPAGVGGAPGVGGAIGVGGAMGVGGRTGAGGSAGTSGQKQLGLPCVLGTECASAYCADSVCCNSLCNGTCVSCLARDNGLSADGTCGNVKDGTDPANECALGTTTCGQDGTCAGGRCRLAPSTTTCGTVTCSNGASSSLLTPLSHCDGSGACPPATAAACLGNVMCASASACKSMTCGADTDCIAGYYCTGGACMQKKTVGGLCTGNNQCANGNCSPDGACCSSTCTLGCQGCNVANTGVASGTCAPRLPATAGGRDLATCNGQCPAGYALCAGAGLATTCNPTSWGFETGAPSDWQDSLAPVNFTQRVPANTAGLPHSGIWALSSFGNQDTFAWESLLGVVLCGGTPGSPRRYMDLRGKTMTIFFYAPTPMPSPGSAGTCAISFTGIDAAGDGFDGNLPNMSFSQYGAWSMYAQSFRANEIASIGSIQIDCTFGAWPAATLYFDDISIK